MPLELVTVPCLSDNYAYLVHNSDSGETALIDAPEVAPIQKALASLGWTLSDILITHHHYDHIEGVDDLRSVSTKVTGSKTDSERLPSLDRAVEGGDTFTLCGEPCEVIAVDGHTIGHVAYYLPHSGIVFTADSLMALGCGRLFEGSAEQMWDSLKRLRALPDDTLVCSGHEYTAANARFALTIEPENEDLQDRAQRVAFARSSGKATVPSRLEEEKATNPFLRADNPLLKYSIGMEHADDVSVFAEVRSRKDKF